MGLIRSLTSGSSSLRAHQGRFDVISNNLANANTVGFKSSRATFADQISQTYNHGRGPAEVGGTGMGGVNPLQFGLGVKMGSVQKDMSQGIIEVTNRPLDVALNGDGYLVYNTNGRNMYSRAGAITRDKAGNLVDANTGAFLQGYNIDRTDDGLMTKDSDNNNILNRTTGNLNIPPGVMSQPRQTSEVSFSGNLSNTMEEGDSRSASIKVFDNTGGPRDLTLTFTKSATDGEFNITAQIEGQDVTLGTGAVQFNPDGTLATPTELVITAADLNAALGSTTIFDEGTPKDITVRLQQPNSLIEGSLTSFSSPSNATALTQDGYQAGDLIGMNVDSQGKIWGSFDNDRTELLGQMVMAKFTNPEGLKNAGNNYFTASGNSGEPNIGTAGEIFPSTSIEGNALELSNVDMTTQFTDLIATQRAFEAASRTVTVSDQLLAEMNNLKR
jgi:flagellar hook protein FlgE